jgi:diguanylate cyclase (GGDEF)-like protein
VTLTVGALLLVFALDRATGAAPFQHLYYLPIILAAVRFRKRGGVIAALAAIVLYHAANPHLLTLAYEESDLVQIVLFLATGAVAGQLAKDAEQMHRLAMTDDLTGLHNLRSFEGRLASMVHEARETGAPMAVLVLDLDRLKSLNDQHGHLAGAEAVRTVGRLIGQSVPSDAVACRYGGDEFVIALPRCDESRARHVAERLRQAVQECAPVLANHPFAAGTLSISVGLADATFTPGVAPGSPSPSDAELGEALFRAADAALYRAKAQGRNRVSDGAGWQALLAP